MINERFDAQEYSEINNKKSVRADEKFTALRFINADALCLSGSYFDR